MEKSENFGKPFEVDGEYEHQKHVEALIEASSEHDLKFSSAGIFLLVSPILIGFGIWGVIVGLRSLFHMFLL